MVIKTHPVIAAIQTIERLGGKTLATFSLSDFLALMEAFKVVVATLPQIDALLGKTRNEDGGTLTDTVTPPSGITLPLGYGLDTDLLKAGVFAGLSARGRNALTNECVTTPRQMMEAHRRKYTVIKSFLDAPNVGVKTFVEVREYLEAAGFVPDEFEYFRRVS